jgi:hypothetical protein
MNYTKATYFGRRVFDEECRIPVQMSGVEAAQFYQIAYEVVLQLLK